MFSKVPQLRSQVSVLLSIYPLRNVLLFRGGIYHHLYINDFIDRNSEVCAQIKRDVHTMLKTVGLHVELAVGLARILSFLR